MPTNLLLAITAGVLLWLAEQSHHQPQSSSLQHCRGNATRRTMQGAAQLLQPNGMAEIGEGEQLRLQHQHCQPSATSSSQHPDRHQQISVSMGGSNNCSLSCNQSIHLPCIRPFFFITASSTSLRSQHHLQLTLYKGHAQHTNDLQAVA
jgi:hypothetical protein